MIALIVSGTCLAVSALCFLGQVRLSRRHVAAEASPTPLVVEFTMTETTHFGRLVDFLVTMEHVADDRCDLELKALVEECRTDLLAEMG